MFCVLVPVRTVTESNTCEHWRKKNARAQQQKAATYRALAWEWSASDRGGQARPTLPCEVTLTRRSCSTMDDDNLVSSQKHVRDAIAKWIGIDDKHSHIVRYAYAQQKVRRGSFGTVVEIRPMEAGAAT
jgi:hypothetical protein